MQLVEKYMGLKTIETLTTALSLCLAAVPSLEDEPLALGLRPVAATLTTIYLEGNPAVSLRFACYTMCLKAQGKLKFTHTQVQHSEKETLATGPLPHVDFSHRTSIIFLREAGRNTHQCAFS